MLARRLAIMAVAAMMAGSIVASAQNVGEKKGWKLEVSLKQSMVPVHGISSMSLGLRKGICVFGLGVGLWMQPYGIDEVPVFAFCRGYLPGDSHRRLKMYCDLNAGVRKRLNDPSYPLNYIFTVHPGLMLRFWSNLSVCVGLSFNYVGSLRFEPGIHAGLVWQGI